MSEQDSLAIKVCRVLCIFFMSYVHVNPGQDFWPADSPGYLQHLGFVLADVLGRASVPALSVLSGFLAAAAYLRRGSWWAYAKDRWAVMIIPMVFWNALIMVLSLMVLWLWGVQTAVLQHLGPLDQLSAWRVVDRLTGVHYGSATSALSFLRDLFVCSLLLPVIQLANRRLGVVAVGLIWLMGMTIGFSPVVMRPHILMFFAVGVYVVGCSTQLVPTWRTVGKIYGTLLLVFALVYVLRIETSDLDQDLQSTAFRLLMASLFLTATVLLSRVKLGQWIARFEPAIFLMYLSHVVVLLVLWGLWQQAFDKDLEWPYAVFFVAAPWATLAVVLLAHRWLRKLPARLQRVVVGKTSS